MRALYSLNIFFYGVAIRIASLFNEKAKLWVTGRQGWKTKLKSAFANHPSKVVWFHCASLGEFEQGRPLMEEFRKRFPEWKILLTFFSPSGYEIRKNYEGADWVFYLPLDTKQNAREFVSIVNPSLVVFVKYEFWLNFLGEIRSRNISHLLVSAIFRDDQVFFKWYGGEFRKGLSGFDMIFTQEENSIKLLQNIGISATIKAGDTRFDRVLSIAGNAKEIPVARLFAGEEKKVLVAGSTWPSDEAVLFPAMKTLFAREWKLIIAPHELGESHLVSIEGRLQSGGLDQAQIVRYSKAVENTVADKKVLLIDNIGMLSSLYRYGRIAYVGGGFGKSIHNILEAAVYGLPVLFGPAHQKFNEANEMKKIGCGISVNNDIQKQLNELTTDTEKLEQLSSLSSTFVRENSGATSVILGYIQKVVNR